MIVEIDLCMHLDNGALCSVWLLEIVLPIPDHLALPDKMVPLLLEPPSATPLSVEGGHRNMMWINTIVHGFSSS